MNTSSPTTRLARVCAFPSSTTYRPAKPQLSSAQFIQSKVPLTHTKHYSSLSKKIPEAMEAIKQTVAQNMGVQGAHTLVPEDQQFDLDQTPNLKGKVAVITGGSEGIGYGCSHTLLAHGIEKLFILSLSEDVINNSLEAIEEEMGAETAKKVIWLQCDLSDWKKTKETADKIAKSTDRLDILINNAGRGIMTMQLTDYGVDRHVCDSHCLFRPC